MFTGKLVGFLKDSASELLNVSWPKKSEIYIFSAIVFVMLIGFGIFFVSVDSLISFILRFILD